MLQTGNGQLTPVLPEDMPPCVSAEGSFTVRMSDPVPDRERLPCRWWCESMDMLEECHRAEHLSISEI